MNKKILVMSFLLSGVVLTILGVSYFYSPLEAEPAYAQDPATISCRGWTEDKVNNKLYVSKNERSVSIGKSTPDNGIKLDVAGTIQSTGLKLPTGAALDKVLTSDAAGIASWKSLPPPPVLPPTQKMIFGGLYQTGGNQGSVEAKTNPVTGAYNCPTGFIDQIIFREDCGDGNLCNQLHICYKLI